MDPFVEHEITPGLFHVSIDPQHAMEEYLVDQLPVRALAGVLTQSRVFTYLAAATPGMRELLTIGKVWELANGVRRTPGAEAYDLVVLDAPATGHGLALLQAPRTFADAARVGPIARQGSTIHAMLVDPTRTGVIAVATPEELPVTEVLSLRDGLRDQAGLELEAVVVNAMAPARFSAAEAEALRDVPGRAARIARGQARRALGQRQQRGRLIRALDGAVTVRTLPALGSAALGPRELDLLSRKLVG